MNVPLQDWIAGNIVREGASSYLPKVEVATTVNESTGSTTFTANVFIQQSIEISDESRFYSKEEVGFLKMVGGELGSSLRQYILDGLNLTEREVVSLLIRTQNKGVKK